MVFVFALLVTAGGLAPLSIERAQAQAAVAARLDDLLGQLKAKTQVGLHVVDVQSRAVVYTRNADTPLKPASLQKLFVTAAALERFGPEFRFRTRLYVQGDELWVVGGGDPGLGDPRLAQRAGHEVTRVFDLWAEGLRRRGVTSLSKIVLDDYVFDEQHRHPDWPDDQADRWYQAPVGGLCFNDNCLDVELVVDGNALQIKLLPDLPAGLWQSTLTVGKKQRPVLRRPPGSDAFELAGTVRRGGHLDPVAAGRPTVFFGYALHRALETRGVAVPGPVVRRQLSPAELQQARPLATHETVLRDVVWRCNRFSQNMFAECLVKALAAYRPDGHRAERAGSWDAGRAVMMETLTGLGLDVGSAEFRDGSGLSHTNRATAGQITSLLVTMRRHPHGPVFLDSLAEPGEEGSLRSRYNDPALRGHLRAKTGTIRAVRCLAGYLTTRSGRQLAFALLLNGPSPRTLPTNVCLTLLDVK
jgi:D-alanyl-D-alanine carboxypeptidase/D-alanyl-D-alanine-endopeptidase (penicillin-binding protein 4)